MMLHRILKELAFFEAGDRTTLAEVLHPAQTGLDLPYSLAFAYLEPGQQSTPHQLAGSELYLFTAGQGKIIVDQQVQAIAAGQVVLVPAHACQWVENTGTDKLEFYCIVSPPWNLEGESDCATELGK